MGVSPSTILMRLTRNNNKQDECVWTVTIFPRSLEDASGQR